MKPKLLITLGCSLTEGVGAYDLSTIPPHINRKNFLNSHESNYIYKVNKPNFHKKGWPNRLGKKLGYDKILNLGYGGSSTSGNLKLFVERDLYKKYYDWEVLVFWYLPEPTRISFYSGGIIRNLIVKGEDSDIEKNYLKMISDINTDPILEQIFYVKIMEQICNNNNWNFLCCGSIPEMDTLIKEMYKTNSYLTSYPFHPFCAIDKPIPNRWFSPVCGHPNALGYEIIANRIYRKITEHHPHLINQSPPTKWEWEWDGNPLKKTLI